MKVRNVVVERKKSELLPQGHNRWKPDGDREAKLAASRRGPRAEVRIVGLPPVHVASRK